MLIDQFSRSLAVLLLTTIISGAAAPTPAYAATPGNDDYLPLAVGNKWVLRSRTVSTPIVLEVTGKSAEGYELKFDNPWISSVLTVQPAAGAVSLTALSMGGQRSAMPSGTVYYDFNVRDGQHWSNRIGTMTLVSRNKTVNASGRRYEHCVEIQEVNSKGDRLFWFFAPGIGFVQFGEGAWAFVLDESSSRLPGHSNAVAGTGTTAVAAASVGSSGGKVWIALAANPAASASFNPGTVNARFDQSVRAGISYVYLSPKWNELEPHQGKYNFKDIDFQIAQAVRNGLPLVCNLRVIDTGNRAMPSDLQHRSLRDREIKDRLLALIDAVMPRLKGRAQYMLIGNEIDSYFKGHRGEVQDYRDLLQAGAARIKQLQPGTRVSASITFDGIGEADSLLKPILDATDFFALTYYPLRPDFTVRDPEVVPSEFTRIIAAAHGKKILLQEVGCPSSPVNNSSEDKQARMFRAVFEQLRAHSNNFIGAYFFLMSDLPDSVVNSLAAYYKLPNADRFKAFLKTLGMFDDQGRPKKSWEVFQQEAPRMKG